MIYLQHVTCVVYAGIRSKIAPALPSGNTYQRNFKIEQTLALCFKQKFNFQSIFLEHIGHVYFLY